MSGFGTVATSVRDRDVLLRPWRAGDVDAVFRACQDPEVQAWTGVPTPYSREDAVGFVAAAPGRWAEGLPSFAVADVADTTLLGSIGFVREPDPGVVEVGYWSAPQARGRGIATAALALVCRWAFAVDPGLARIEWQAYAGNDRSWRVAQRCGFVMEGTLRSRAVHDGRRHDVWIAARLREDGWAC